MKKFMWILGIGVFFVFVLIPDPGYSELSKPELENIEIFKEIIIKDLDKKEETVNEWKKMGWFSLTLIILVFVCGISSSAINHSTFRGSKIAITVIGIVISVVTGVQNKIFPADYRSYGLAADQYEKEVSSVRRQIFRKINFSDIEDFTQWSKEMDAQIVALEATSQKIRKEMQLTLNLSSVAYAGGAVDRTAERPAWVTNTPKGGNNHWFVGLGVGESIKGARKKSRKDAKGKAKEFLIQELNKGTDNPKKVEQIAEEMVSSAKIRKYYIDYGDDKVSLGPGVKGKAVDYSYRYYVLLGISKNSVKRNVQIYDIQQKSLSLK